MNLKDYRPDSPDFEDEEPAGEQLDNTPITSSGYQEEITTLKIDKLSNRVTIISIIIPCIIGAIVIFAYLDMKEKVVVVDKTKSTQVERISQQVEERLNALDIRIAKNRSDLDKELPEISTKQVALEGTLTKIANAKADIKALKSMSATLDEKIAKNSKLHQANRQNIDNTRKQITGIAAENKTGLENTTLQFREELKKFSEEFDARLLELNQYEDQISKLRIDISVLQKQIKQLKSESLTTAAVDQKIADSNAGLQKQFEQIKQKADKLEQKTVKLEKNLNANITRLDNKIEILIKSTASPGPQPLTNADTTVKEETIEQESMDQ